MGALNFDPYAALAEIRKPPRDPAKLANPAKVGAKFSSFSKISRPSRPEPDEEALPEPLNDPAPRAEFDERAAIIEDGAGVPREWAEGFARLVCAPRLAGFTPDQWQHLIDDGGRFLDHWGRDAAALGWSAIDVFGVVPSLDATNRPLAQVGQMAGLVPLIGGGEVIDIRADRATIRMPSGNCLIYYLRRPSAGAIAVWEMAAGPPRPSS